MKPLNFTPFPTLKTKRLLLRRLQESDAEAVYKLRTDKEVNTFIQRPPERKENNGTAFVSKIDTDISTNQLVYWAISLKENPKMIGSICLWSFSNGTTVAEVGYDLGINYQGKGYMSEALNAVVNFGLNDLEFKSIEAFTHKDNKASTSLLLKHDFKLDINRTDADNKNNIIFIKDLSNT